MYFTTRFRVASDCKGRIIKFVIYNIAVYVIVTNHPIDTLHFPTQTPVTIDIVYLTIDPLQLRQHLAILAYLPVYVTIRFRVVIVKVE